MTLAHPAVQPIKVGKYSPRSFRTKFILVVGAAVIFDLILGGGIALWNVQRLSHDAIREVGNGLTQSAHDYLRTYIDATAQQADTLFMQVNSEVTMMADTVQELIDHPAAQERIGTAIEDSAHFSSPLKHNQQRNWTQSEPGASSVVSIWGYLLGPDGKPTPKTVQQVRDSAILGLIGPAAMATGTPKLQVYYVGPKDASIVRAVPYANVAGTFDKLYPGHNKGPNFWDFFFPGLYEGWQSWIRDPNSRPFDTNIVSTPPYVDANSGKLIVSFFHPLWSKDRKSVAGMVATDITLGKLAKIVERMNVAKTGFGFLTMDGNVVATSKLGRQTLGLRSKSDTGNGVTSIDRHLSNSMQAAVASLKLPPPGQKTTIHSISINRNGESIPYLVVLKQIMPMNVWNGKSIVGETMTVGLMVPEAEIYKTLTAAQAKISNATVRIIAWQVGAVLVSLLLVLGVVFAISGRITAGLSQLANAARRLEKRDYSVRVTVPTRDEVADVAHAFNRMAEEISFHTENLEQIVKDRTRKLESANREIVALNKRLKSENLRMGAELDVARQIQMMVLPKANELSSIPQIEIAGYMEPADEIGGDYYDVLQEGTRIKVGIGDVTGHGLESGVLMLMVQSVARALQERGQSDPKQFLEVLNSAIYKNIARTNSDKHLTLAFLDYEDRNITLTGQHEEVLVVRENGAVERINTMDLGFPIGLEDDISAFIETRNIRFDTGDLIVLHTDGVTEAANLAGELFGFDRFCDSVRRHRHGSADEIIQGVIGDLMAHIGTQKIYDDITLVVMRHR